jgi:hypothetical protein
VDASRVADAIRRGVSSGSTVVYVPAVLRVVMAMLRCLPGPVFRRLFARRAPGRPAPPRPAEPATRTSPGGAETPS